MELEGTRATLTLPEKAPLRYRSFASAVPSDLKLLCVMVVLRGVVAPAGDRLELRARGSGQILALANKDAKKDDITGALARNPAKPPRYFVTGELVELERVETLLLGTAPSPTDWKDLK